MKSLSGFCWWRLLFEGLSAEHYSEREAVLSYCWTSPPLRKELPFLDLISAPEAIASYWAAGGEKKKKKDSCLIIIHLSWDKSFQVWFCFCGLTLSKLGAGMTNNVPVYSLCSSLQEAFVMLYTQITTLRVERTAWMKCLGKKFNVARQNLYENAPLLAWWLISLAVPSSDVKGHPTG